MEIKINKDKGWSEAILDDDCEFEKFYRTAALLEEAFQGVFTQKLNDFDSLYWDFEYKGSSLILHYNIYMGISLFPAKFKEATVPDNKNVEELGALLFARMLDQDWYNFEEGKTIGANGPEEGWIITDLENVHGARITVEKDTATAPFAITYGIYGLLFHTHYKPDEANAGEYVAWLKARINKVFDMYELPESYRTEEWYHQHDRLVHELTID